MRAEPATWVEDGRLLASGMNPTARCVQRAVSTAHPLRDTVLPALYVPSRQPKSGELAHDIANRVWGLRNAVNITPRHGQTMSAVVRLWGRVGTGGSR